MKYRLSQIAAVVGGRFSGTDCEVQSVVTDSRSLTCELGSGPVFVAMCGANHDSHAFVAQMYARGVRAFMVERPLEALPECGYVVVENAIAALQCLAAYHRAQFRGTVVGITGSNGKTVIKEWIAEELPAGMKCYRSPKSYNSQLGVPLSVLMIEGDEQLALIEAGISKPGRWRGWSASSVPTWWFSPRSATRTRRISSIWSRNATKRWFWPTVPRPSFTTVITSRWAA